MKGRIKYDIDQSKYPEATEEQWIEWLKYHLWNVGSIKNDNPLVDCDIDAIKTCDYMDYDRHICVVDIDCLECDVYRDYVKRGEMDGMDKC